MSEQMLERARARVAESGHVDVELVRADAATHGFEPRAFDLLFLLVPIHLGGSATLDEAVDYCCQIGPAARLLSTLEPAVYSEAREAVRRVLEPFASDRGVWLDAAAWIVTANSA